MRKLKDLTEEEKLGVLLRKKEGVPVQKIKEEFGISDRSYYDILRKNGCEIKKKVQKYNFNEDYFETIDTEDKAYFLGFIVADGCVRSIKSQKMTLKLKKDDYSIIETFINFINYQGLPYYFGDYVQITLSGSKIINDLNNLGITENKTMIVKYPIIPENLNSHFMRGVFDGDGCISIHHDKRDNSDRGQVNICSGSIDFINTYVDNLVNYANIKRNNIRCPRGTYNVVDWGGLTDVENIYNFLYKDATVFLERKKETFDKVMTIHNSKNKYRKK
jgi:hypothetical protein